MNLTTQDKENILSTWVSLCMHIDSLSEEGLLSLIESEFEKQKPRPTFIYRLHHRHNKLRNEREKSSLNTRLVMKKR